MLNLDQYQHEDLCYLVVTAIAERNRSVKYFFEAIATAAANVTAHKLTSHEP
ncbi:hypothetical protein [Picosynechococcus sp. PCC 73109]|uniref:hypothetical protein n=1 Tax=Picosynechococcus sp. PCC 73109 TaxID=374982 RepID=UPI0018DE18DB|nr:hypothetical protein [Picosynechococcus sp. PCC 73109]